MGEHKLYALLLVLTGIMQSLFICTIVSSSLKKEKKPSVKDRKSTQPYTEPQMNKRNETRMI